MSDTLADFYEAVEKAKLGRGKPKKPTEAEKPLLYRRQGVLDGRNPHRRYEFKSDADYAAAHAELKKAGIRSTLRRLDPTRPARVRRQFATRPKPTHIPNAGPEHKVDVPGFHGTPKKIQGRRLRPTRTQGKGLPEPTGVSYATRAQTARQFGGKLYRSRLRGNVGDAETFMRRAREHMKRGRSDGDASARTQREFESKGYHGVRWGDREVVMFRGRRARIHKARALYAMIAKARGMLNV